MNFSFFIARYIASNSKKSFSRLIIRIATVAVALSVAVMIITAATVRGFKNQISQKIFGLWGQIHISDASINQSFETKPISLKQDFYPYKNLHEKVNFTAEKEDWLGNTKVVEGTTLGGIRHIQAFATIPGIIKTQDEIEGVLLKGAGTDFDWQFMQSCLTSGRVIQFKDSLPSRDILISQITADRLKVKAGDKFVVYFMKNNEQIKRMFEIAGVYKTGLEEYDKKIAFADLRMVQQLLNWKPDQVSGFEIFLDHHQDIAPMTEFVYNDLIPNNLYAQSIREKFPSIFEWLDLQDVNEYVIIILMAVVAIINMITALLILILERTEMIGILKSLGTRNWKIRQIFLYQAAWIIGVGLFWGNFIGIGFGLIQKKYKFIKLSESDYYLSYVPIELNIPTILIINFATLALVLLFLILPSYLVTKISPVKAIRFK
jgi:lipoprotein-releasing system permease protein